MLAKPVARIPEGMLYEPKFDGFRCILFRDGKEVELASRNTRPLTRYFPEVVSEIKAQLPAQIVVDGEIVVTSGESLDFEALQQRIHPAASRIDLLAKQTPASLILFDLLALDGDSLTDSPFAGRRAALESALEGVRPPLFLTPITSSVEVAEEWFRTFEGAGLDGVIAKPADGRYVQDQRVMFKIKHERTADCVVGGFRFHKTGPVVGSLLLGLYDEAGTLQHVGVAAAFSMARRKKLLEEIAPFRLKHGERHPWAADGGLERIPGGAPSRWNAGKDTSWEPLRPELVAEVAYDHMEGPRFRHVTQFRRWRPDKDPRSCTFSQLDQPVAFHLGEVLSAGT